LRAFHTFSVTIVLLIAGCAPQRNNPMSISYHDLTAHYNAYFISNEHIKYVEENLYTSYVWNYDKILPVHIPIDSNRIGQYQDRMEDCIQKASIAIQRHPGSRWEYPSYILVGKARLYRMELPEAIETYKYVNTKSEDLEVRQEALLDLMRTFVVAGELNNALAVADYLRKDPMKPKFMERYYINLAYIHQTRGDLDKMVENLVKAEELLTSSREKARIRFIIGQVYQQLRFNASAYHYYQKCLKSNPSYELTFFTKLNMAQVTEVADNGDVRRIQRYFKSLLADRKNVDYKDKIYYELARFELKNGNLDEAIRDYKLSIKAHIRDKRQLGLSYLGLADVYYDSLRKYELAKLYYDSTVQVLPQTEDNYAAIKNRQVILEDFVKHLTTIRTNDSLIALSRLPEDSVRVLLTAKLEAKKADEEKQRKAKERQARAPDRGTSGEQASLIQTEGSGSWYFANQSTLASGFNNFRRKWGNRPLEDHWRRSQKTIQTLEETPAIAQTPALSQDKSPKEDERPSESVVDEQMEAIPFTDAAREVLLGQIEEAYYKLGNIYSLQLNEKKYAAETFETLIERFEDSQYEPELLYQLYLIYKEPKPDLSRERANTLLRKYPESIYARLVENPNYREETFAIMMHLQRVYKRAYGWYDAGLYEESRLLLDSALNIHPNHDFSDNLALLRVLNTGRMEGQYKYQFELDNFIKAYPNSELVPYAMSLVKASEDYKAKLYSSSRARFIQYFDQRHYFVLLYPGKKPFTESTPELIGSFMKDNNVRYKYGNLLLSEEFSMVIINEIPTKAEAMKLVRDFIAQKDPITHFKGEKYYVFAMSEDNFDIFYRTKDISTYESFFRQHYQQ
jgi:tetratricopeptide (TPR) repeat protein